MEFVLLKGSMLDNQGLCTGRDLYRATPAVTRGLGFSSSKRPPYPAASYDIQGNVEDLLLTWILTVDLSVAFWDIQGDVEDLF